MVEACQELGLTLEPTAVPHILGLEMNSERNFTFQHRISNDEQCARWRCCNKTLDLEEVLEYILDLLEEGGFVIWLRSSSSLITVRL
jgi:hypothetical protein